jgi:hypothetical protein
MDIAQDIELLALGLIPAGLTYDIKKNNYIDWSKLEYNSRYKKADYYYNKLPKAVKNLPGLYEHCEKLASYNVSPLESLLQLETGERDARDILYDA